jgi:chromosome segregation ATPase
MTATVLDELKTRKATESVGASAAREAAKREIVRGIAFGTMPADEAQAKMDEHDLTLAEVEGDDKTEGSVRWLQKRIRLVNELADLKSLTRRVEVINAELEQLREEKAKMLEPINAKIRTLDDERNQIERGQQRLSRHRQDLAQMMPSDLTEARKTVGTRLQAARDQVPALRDAIPALERRLVELQNHLKRARARLSTLPVISGMSGDRLAQVSATEARNQLSSTIAEVEREQRQAASNLTAARHRLEECTASIARDEAIRQRLDKLVFTAWPDPAEIAQLAAE